MLRLINLLIIISAFLVCISGSAFAGSATVSWQANTEADLKGYKVFIGTASRNYSESVYVDKTNRSHLFDNLNEGVKYYFSVTALDTSNNESGFSQEVYKIIENSSSPEPDIPDQELSAPGIPQGVIVQ